MRNHEKINTLLFKWNLLRTAKLLMDLIFTTERVTDCCFDFLVCRNGRRLDLVWYFSGRGFGKDDLRGGGFEFTVNNFILTMVF